MVRLRQPATPPTKIIPVHTSTSNTMFNSANRHKMGCLKAAAADCYPEVIFAHEEHAQFDPSTIYGIRRLHDKIDEYKCSQMSDNTFELKCQLARRKNFSQHGRTVTEYPWESACRDCMTLR